MSTKRAREGDSDSDERAERKRARAARLAEARAADARATQAADDARALKVREDEIERGRAGDLPIEIMQEIAARNPDLALLQRLNRTYHRTSVMDARDLERLRIAEKSARELFDVTFLTPEETRTPLHRFAPRVLRALRERKAQVRAHMAEVHLQDLAEEDARFLDEQMAYVSEAFFWRLLMWYGTLVARVACYIELRTLIARDSLLQLTFPTHLSTMDTEFSDGFLSTSLRDMVMYARGTTQITSRGRCDLVPAQRTTRYPTQFRLDAMSSESRAVLHHLAVPATDPAALGDAIAGYLALATNMIYSADNVHAEEAPHPARKFAELYVMRASKIPVHHEEEAWIIMCGLHKSKVDEHLAHSPTFLVECYNHGSKSQWGSWDELVAFTRQPLAADARRFVRATMTDDEETIGIYMRLPPPGERSVIAMEVACNANSVRLRAAYALERDVAGAVRCTLTYDTIDAGVVDALTDTYPRLYLQTAEDVPRADWWAPNVGVVETQPAHPVHMPDVEFAHHGRVSQFGANDDQEALYWGAASGLLHVVIHPDEEDPTSLDNLADETAAVLMSQFLVLTQHAFTPFQRLPKVYRYAAAADDI